MTKQPSRPPGRPEKAGMREKILAVASHLLSTEGSQALSMRRITKEAGCSTMVLYSHFGGKEGVIEALFLEGFERLHEAVLSIEPAANPRQQILNLCRTYRQVAHTYPTHYAIMFLNAVPEFRPSDESRKRAKASMEPLLAAVTHWLEVSGRSEDPEILAMQIWAASHGHVALELTRFMPEEIDQEEIFLNMIDRMLK